MLQTILGTIVVGAAVIGGICILMITQLPRAVVLRSEVMHMEKIYRRGWVVPRKLMTPFAKKLHSIFFICLAIFVLTLSILIVTTDLDQSLF